MDLLIDLVAAKVVQDAREVNTKYSKSFTTWFFPVGDDIRATAEEWVAYLRDQKLWGGDDPLFPATAVVNGTSLKFEVSGLARRHWSNAGPIRAIFRSAFTLAGLTYFNPHSFRKTLAQLGERVCRTPEEPRTGEPEVRVETRDPLTNEFGQAPPMEPNDTRDIHFTFSVDKPVGRPGKTITAVVSVSDQLGRWHKLKFKKLQPSSGSATTNPL